MINTEDINNIAGTTVYGSDGSKIGSAKQVYLDDQTGRPEWVTVNTGLFGTNESFVPLSAASLPGDRLEVPFDKATIKDAPQVGADGHLEPHEEERLYEYYGLAGGNFNRDNADFDRNSADLDRDRSAGFTGDRDTVGYDTSGPTTDDAMTRSEERLNVGTEQVVTGRARLRKFVVTENVTTTVPVSREEVRVVTEPITDANIGDATSGPTLSEEEHEVILHAEQPVVSKETVPVERVRLDTQTVTQQQQVSEQVQKEQIELDGADDRLAASNSQRDFADADGDGFADRNTTRR